MSRPDYELRKPPRNPDNYDISRKAVKEIMDAMDDVSDEDRAETVRYAAAIFYGIVSE